MFNGINPALIKTQTFLHTRSSAKANADAVIFIKKQILFEERGTRKKNSILKHFIVHRLPLHESATSLA